MDIETETSRKLHDEHMTVRAFLEKLGARLAAQKAGELPSAEDRAIAGLLGDLSAIVESELAPHFRFEEEVLFPLLKLSGAADMTELLTEEHNVILPLGYELCELARSFPLQGYTRESWGRFRRGGMEFAERLIAHIDKEEMGLVPMLDTLVDQDKDIELINVYAAMR